MTVVLLAAVDPRVLPEHLCDCLSAPERARAGRYRRAADRAEFIAGRAVLQAGLRRWFGVTGAVVVAPPGAKPMLAGTGVPAGLDFSLSHGSGLVACALAMGAAVGIDVESLDRAVDGPSIAAAHFGPEEQALVDDSASFLRLWTLKEAVAKAVGLGLALPLSSFACTLDPPGLLRAGAALGEVAAWRLESWSEARHVLALATRGGDAAARVTRVELATLAA